MITDHFAPQKGLLHNSVVDCTLKLAPRVRPQLWLPTPLGCCPPLISQPSVGWDLPHAAKRVKVDIERRSGESLRCNSKVDIVSFALNFACMQDSSSCERSSTAFAMRRMSCIQLLLGIAGTSTVPSHSAQSPKVGQLGCSSHIFELSPSSRRQSQNERVCGCQGQGIV